MENGKSVGNTRENIRSFCEKMVTNPTKNVVIYIKYTRTNNNFNFFMIL